MLSGIPRNGKLDCFYKGERTMKNFVKNLGLIAVSLLLIWVAIQIVLGVLGSIASTLGTMGLIGATVLITLGVIYQKKIRSAFSAFNNRD